jgi:hypothetical protein
VKLTVPLLEIAEDEGFSEEKDIFKRKEFGERLASLIENSDGELVIALDAPWGEGKSTFIKMWQGHLKKKDNGVHTIYFDAFANDHQSAPFLALAGEIYNLIGKRKKAVKSQFEQKAVAAFNTGGRIGFDLATRFMSGGIVNGEILKHHAKDAFGNEAESALADMDKYVSHSLKSVSANKKAIKEFKKYLENLPRKLSYNGKSIVFIIDELDRCKPPFALEIVEVVKHLFSVPNITFVLVMNRSQLEASVTKEYGTDDPSKYLQKFINLWISLPKVHVSDEATIKVYLQYCAKQMGMEWQNQSSNDWSWIFEELGAYYRLSLRDIERSLTNLAFIRQGLKENDDLTIFYKLIAAYLCIIKVVFPNEYNQLAASEINYQDLFTRTRLTKVADEYADDHSSVKQSVRWVLRYCLIDEKERRSFLEHGSPFSPSELPRKKNLIQYLCQWLDSFRIN